MTKAIFWDFDGTLVHPNQSFFDSLKAALAENKYNISDDEIWAVLKDACTWYNFDITYPDKTGEQWWVSFFEKFEPLFEKYQISSLNRENIKTRFRAQILGFDHYVLYDDAKSVLEACIRKGYKNYIISNNYPELADAIHHFGLEKYFTECFVSANIGYEKPRKEIFQIALEKAGYPEVCYMIGDNPVADVLGGKAAGMKTILVHHEDRHEEDHNCKVLAEILQLLEDSI